MNWLTILTLILKVAAAIAATIREKGLLDAGAKAQLAHDLATLSARLDIADSVAHNIEAMSTDEIDSALRG